VDRSLDLCGLLRGRFGLSFGRRLPWALDGAATAAAELDVGGKRGSAPRARDDRSSTDRTPAVGAEVRAPGERRTAFAPEALVERNKVGAALGHQFHAEPISSEHLEDQAPEIADALLSLAQQRPVLAFERRGLGGTARRLTSGGARAPTSAERPERCHQGTESS
jgi:hypothetical protein